MGRFFFDFLLLSLCPGDVTVGAIVTDQLFSLIGDVGGDLRDPVQDKEQGKVSLEVRVHLGSGRALARYLPGRLSFADRTGSGGYTEPDSPVHDCRDFGS